MRKIEVIASDRGLDRVTVTNGRNGYPSGLRAAVVFDTQEEAASFAREIGGEVVLLHRRDGWNLWESRGRASVAYEFNLRDRAYNDDYEPCAFALRYERDYEQALDEMNALIDDAGVDEDEREQYEPDQSVLNTLANYDGRALVVVLFVGGQQTIDYVFEDGATRWHDSDVNEYAIAVMCDDEWTDEFRSLSEFCDYWNECDDLPSRYEEILAANGWADGDMNGAYVCYGDGEAITYHDGTGRFECVQVSARPESNAGLGPSGEQWN